MMCRTASKSLWCLKVSSGDIDLWWSYLLVSLIKNYLWPNSYVVLLPCRIIIIIIIIRYGTSTAFSMFDSYVEPNLSNLINHLRPNSYVVLLPCRIIIIIIRYGTSTAFSMFDSYVEPNLSNLITNQAKISFIRKKMTVVIKILQR